MLSLIQDLNKIETDNDIVDFDKRLSPETWLISLTGDRLAFVDSGEEKLTVCKLHDGADEHCFKPTSALSPFKPLSLVVDEHSNIKVSFSSTTSPFRTRCVQMEGKHQSNFFPILSTNSLQVYNKTTNTVCTWQGKPNWRDLGKWRDAHRAFGSMRGMCKDFKQIIYIVDSSEGCVSAHHTDGKRIRTFGRGKLKRPACVGSDHLGRIYVTDEKDCSVSVFDEMGNFIFKFGSEGEDQGQFMGPTGIAVDPQGNVFVADTLNNRISVLAPDGRFKHHLVADSDIMRPSGIDLSSDGLLAVTSQYITFRSVSVFKLR